MVEQVVRLTVDFTVSDGQMNEFKSIAAKMTEGTKPEPGTLGYEWFVSGDGMQFSAGGDLCGCGRCRGALHGPVVQQLVPKLAAVCTVDGFEFYGEPGAKGVGDGGEIRSRVLPVLDGNQPLTTMPGISAPGIDEHWTNLLLVQIDLLVLVAGDAGANLGRSLAQLGLRVGVEPFLGAGGALGSVQSSKQLRRLVWPRARSQRQLQGNW